MSARIVCFVRRIVSRLRGDRWDGHCWAATIEGIQCVDCGRAELFGRYDMESSP